MSFDQVVKIDDVFFYNEEFCILGCIICQYCIENIKNIKTHIKQQHKYKFEDINIDEYVNNLINTYNIKDLKDVQLPVFKKHCFEYLTIYNNAYCCLHCEYACLSEKFIKVHCNKVHNYKKKSKYDENLYIDNQKVQCFSQSTYKQYFVIKDQPKMTIVSDNVQKNMLTVYHQKLSNINKQQDQSNTNQKNISMFLQNSHFHEYIIEKDVDFLSTLVEKPNKTEEFHLNLIYNHVIDLCHASESVINSFSRRFLQLINTEKNVELNKNMIAFKALQEMNSKKDYYKLFAELFCYVYRIYFNEISYEQPVITKNIQLILHNIKKYITHYTEKEENSEEQVMFLNELNIQYILFFHKLLKQKTTMQNINNISVFNSCVITFLIIKSFNNQTKTFKSEEKISKFCSYLIYTFRLFSLRYLYYKNEQYNENQQEFNISLAFTKLKTNCLTNTSDNCFEEITQIRAYCKKISMHENARAKIVEISDDIIKYENTEIVISQLSTFFHTLIKKAKSILYEDLLLMNENEVKSLISINDIEDSLNETTVNFYFVDYITKKQDLLK